VDACAWPARRKIGRKIGVGKIGVTEKSVSVHIFAAPEIGTDTDFCSYAKDGKVVCFFQSAQKFKTRYATFGFMQEANLDEGAMRPTAFALKELSAAEEARIGALVKKAVS
jgi:hypothetical protein